MSFDNLSDADQSIYSELALQHEENIAKANEQAASNMVEEMKAENADNPEFDEAEAKQKIIEYLQDYPDAIYPYLVRGAKLYCRMGTHIRKLNLPICHGVYTGEGKHPFVHAEDAVPEVNVMYFGHCNGTINASGIAEQIDLEMVSYDKNLEPKATGTVKRAYKCIPDIIETSWSMTHHDTRIVKNGLAMVDSNAADSVTGASFLVCRFGGLIEPLTSGQENDEDTEPLKEEEPSDSELDSHGYNPDMGAEEDYIECYGERYTKILNLEKALEAKNAYLDDPRYVSLLNRCETFNIEQYKKDFVLEVFPLLYQQELSTGIPIEIMFGQICTESAYGQDPLAIRGNNYFGYKGTGSAGSIEIQTKEYINGEYVTITDTFRAYHSMEESISDYVNLLQRNYAQYAKDNSPQSWASALEQGGYATAPNYGSSILDVSETWRIYAQD